MNRLNSIKKAFTLAEVLITIGIIGILAVILIEPLVLSVQDKEYKESLKKIYAELNQATLMIKQDNNGTLIGAFTGNNYPDTLYKNYLKTLRGGDHNTGDCQWNNNDCWASKTYWLDNDVASTGVIQPAGFVLPNGAFVNFYMWDNNCNNLNYNATIPICGDVLVDVNGYALPNTYGKDIFKFVITADSLLPFGKATANEVNDACSRTGTAICLGSTCADYVMRGIDY